MKRITKKAWFGPKRVAGWGWAPVSWEGWLASAIYLALVMITSMLMDKSKVSETVIGLTVALILLVVLTGDKPGGPRWSNKK